MLRGEAQEPLNKASKVLQASSPSNKAEATSTASEEGDDAHACAEEWTAAVARSAGEALVPMAEDIADLVPLPPTPLGLPAAGACPAATAFYESAEGWAALDSDFNGKGTQRTRHPIAVAMQLAAVERARRAGVGRSGAPDPGFLPAPSSASDAHTWDSDIKINANETSFGLDKEVCKLDAGPWVAMFERAAAGLGAAVLDPLAALPPVMDVFYLPEASEIAKADSKVPHEAATWAASLPLSVLADRALLAPLRAKTALAGRAACDAVLEAGLMPQLASLRALALAAGPAVDPLADHVITRCSTPAGVDGLSLFDLNAFLAAAVDPGAPEGLVGIATARATVARAPPSAGPQTPAPSVASLRRVQLHLEPAFPLSLVASAPFLEAHTALCTLSLQLRWVGRSLVAARVGAWKAGRRGISGDVFTPATKKAQQEMLVLVTAARDHLVAAVGAAGVRLERNLQRAATLDDVMRWCREYEADLRREERFWGGETALGVALAGALQAALRHSVLAGQGRRAAAKLAEIPNTSAALSAAPSEASLASLQQDTAAGALVEDGGSESGAEAAQQRLERVRAALEATEREFEGHRAALMAVVAAEGGQAGAHSAAAAALLAAVDAGRRMGV